MYRIGLKGLLKELHNNGGGIKYKFNTLLWQLKYAWQRAWKGYDSVEIFELGYSFKTKMIVLLNEYKKYNCSLWRVPEEYQKYKIGTFDEIINSYFFTKEQTDVIIETIIFHLQMSDEDYVEKKVYGSNIYDHDYKFGCRDINDYKKISRIAKQNQDEAMNLLKLFLDDLWY